MNAHKFGQAVKDFQDLGRERYGDYAYNAGFLGSMLEDMFFCLNKRDQAQFIIKLEAAATRIKEGLTQVG